MIAFIWASKTTKGPMTLAWVTWKAIEDIRDRVVALLRL